MWTKRQPGRYDRYSAADDDEPMFVLLGRDPMAGALVRLWATMRGMPPNQDPVDNVRDAFDCASQMEAYAKKLGRDPSWVHKKFRAACEQATARVTYEDNSIDKADGPVVIGKNSSGDTFERSATRLIADRTVGFFAGHEGSDCTVRAELFKSTYDEDRGGFVLRVRLPDTQSMSTFLPHAKSLPDGAEIHACGEAEGAAFLEALKLMLEEVPRPDMSQYQARDVRDEAMMTLVAERNALRARVAELEIAAMKPPTKQG